jgi:arginyl-tRNA synthetase
MTLTLLDELRGACLRAVADYARSRGIPAPEDILLAPAPAHAGADASLSWPMQAAKALGRKPTETAAELAASLQALPMVEKASAAPPGFVNLRWTSGALSDGLARLLSPGERAFGFDPSLEKHNYLLEFVSANPTGPVHVASARAATLGDSLARILRRRGHEVKTEYYVNDAGRQVDLLGESVKARYDEINGRAGGFPEDGYRGEYIRDLAASAPAEAGAWDAADFSRFAIERMLSAHRADMDLFGVRFDRWFPESSLHASGAPGKTLAKLRALGRVYEKDGAVWLGSSETEAGDDKDRVLIRKDGRPTYFLADIAYHEDKLSRGFDRLVNILGADHHGYVPRMKAALLALGEPPERFLVVVHQLVHLFRGKESVKMSKRAGEFVTLRDLMSEAGVDACRFFFALRGPNAHMNFDIELAKKQSQENPVFYVQYVHARIRSIFREAAKHGLEAVPGPCEEPAARALLAKLAWFPEALRTCERELSPHPLAVYLMELSGLFHPFYEQCRVVDSAEPALSRARLALCGGAAAVIRDGLDLLGVSAPEAM